MKITNKFIIHDRFQAALEKLNQMPIPAKQCLELNQSIDELVSHQNLLARTRSNIISKLAVKSEDGSLVLHPNGDIVFPDKQTEDTCKKELEDLLNESLEIPLSKRIVVKGDTLWSPLELRLLDEMIEVKE